MFRETIFGAALFLNYAAGYLHNDNDIWEVFKTSYNKTYSSAIEEEVRRNIFWDSMHTITAHNIKYKLKMTNFRIGLNQHADKTFQQFLDMNPVNETIKKKMDEEFEKLNYDPLETFELSLLDDELPKAFDWRDSGAVNPVKNQFDCSACYAMAAVGALESQIFIKTGQLVQLSEQEIVDCARDYSNFQCSTGVPFRVFDYIKDHGGLSLSADYPFEGVSGECRVKDKRMKIKVEGTGSINSEESSDKILMQALIKKGPLIIGLGVVQESFMRYANGIYSESNCPTTMNHACLLIGFGSENGEDYWILKNSWGESWGESGYMRLSRNMSCEISSSTMYPILK